MRDFLVEAVESPIGPRPVCVAVVYEHQCLFGERYSK